MSNHGLDSRNEREHARNDRRGSETGVGSEETEPRGQEIEAEAEEIDVCTQEIDAATLEIHAATLEITDCGHRKRRTAKSHRPTCPQFARKQTSQGLHVARARLQSRL